MKVIDQVFQYLQGQGLQPKKDEDGDILFKYNQLTFIYHEAEDDEGYFRMSLPAIFEVTEDNREAVLEACNQMNKTMKLSKTILPNDTVWVSFEIFIDRDPEWNEIIPRALHVLMDTRDEFFDVIG